MNDHSNEVLEMFTQTGALLEGHFKLSSGRHSDRYMQCAKVLQHPAFARKIGQYLADRFRNIKCSVVVAPAIGGILVAHELAASLGVRAIFGERENGIMSLRRGFQIDPGELAIVVEDVITTGKSTREVIEMIEKHEGIVAATGGIVDRTDGSVNLPSPPQCLIRINIDNWEESLCPLCKRRIPLQAPGSRFKS